MSPEPYVRAQALALALTLIAAAVVGPPLAGLIAALIVAMVAWILRSRYRGDVRAAGAEIPAHRERLDRIVDGDLQTAIAAGMTAGAIMVGFSVTPLDMGLAAATPVLLAVAAAGVYLSSLFDWYITLPRMTGLLGSRPCRIHQTHHVRWPKTWRETTRWWYVHRIIAALALRFGLAYALTLTVHRYVSVLGGTTIVVAAALGAFAAYVAAVPRAAIQAGHPTLIVGRTIRRRRTRPVARRFGVGSLKVNLPLKKWVVDEDADWAPREYVYDVALEGVQFVRARAREGEVPRLEDGAISFERDPVKVPLKALDVVEPADRPFRGCNKRCSGINWYCIENPRCFETK